MQWHPKDKDIVLIAGDKISSIGGLLAFYNITTKNYSQASVPLYYVRSLCFLSDGQVIVISGSFNYGNQSTIAYNYSQGNASLIGPLISSRF